MFLFIWETQKVDHIQLGATWSITEDVCKGETSIKHQIAGLGLLDNVKRDCPVLGSFLTSVLKSTDGVPLGINVLWYFLFGLLTLYNTNFHLLSL